MMAMFMYLAGSIEMPLTPAQIKARIVKALVPKYRATLTWPELVGGFQNATAGQKAGFLTLAQGESPHAIGQKFLQILQAELEVMAGEEADVRMADGSLDLADLDRVWGDG